MVKAIIIILIIVVVFVLFNFSAISSVLNLSFLSTFIDNLSFIPDFFVRSFALISSYSYILLIFNLFFIPFLVCLLISLIKGGKND